MNADIDRRRFGVGADDPERIAAAVEQVEGTVVWRPSAQSLAEFERLLSAPFIVSPDYGTRSSTALTLGRRCRIAERQFDPAGRTSGERIFGWEIE